MSVTVTMLCLLVGIWLLWSGAFLCKLPDVILAVVMVCYGQGEIAVNLLLGGTIWRLVIVAVKGVGQPQTMVRSTWQWSLLWLMLGWLVLWICSGRKSLSSVVGIALLCAGLWQVAPVLWRQRRQWWRFLLTGIVAVLGAGLIGYGQAAVGVWLGLPPGFYALLVLAPLVLLPQLKRTTTIPDLVQGAALVLTLGLGLTTVLHGALALTTSMVMVTIPWLGLLGVTVLGPLYWHQKNTRMVGLWVLILVLGWLWCLLG